MFLRHFNGNVNFLAWADPSRNYPSRSTQPHVENNLQTPKRGNLNGIQDSSLRSQLA